MAFADVGVRTLPKDDMPKAPVPRESLVRVEPLGRSESLGWRVMITNGNGNRNITVCCEDDLDWAQAAARKVAMSTGLRMCDSCVRHEDRITKGAADAL